MAVGFASYEIARSGLTVNERGLYVTGHNISNVNTQGYVRQQLIIKNGPVQTEFTKAGMVQLGLGADIQQIRQIRHSFLDNIYRQENTTLGYWEARQKTFQDVQAIMAEPMDSGLQNILNQFWDSWQELSKEPDSLTVRALVRQRGEALVEQINHMGSQFDRLQSDLNSEISARIDEVNEITAKIANLNMAIFRAEVSGDKANDYRDQRNSLIDRLAKLASVDVNEMQDGQVDITLGGYFLVQKTVSTKLYADERNPGDIFYVPKLEGTNIVVPVKNGILKGLIESRGEVSGAIGGIGNGTPNTMADIVFYVDTNSMTASDAALRLNAYKTELLKKGIDCNVSMVTFAAAGIDDIAAQIAATAGLRPDVNKYAVIITDNSTGDFSALQNILGAMGMDASVLTASPAAAAWTALVGATDGKTYDIAGPDYAAIMKNAAGDTGMDIGEGISMIPATDNIVSDMRARLNALINLLAREVNYLHRGGMTMGDAPVAGGDFFTAINTGRPLEMGNIRINPNLGDLDNIAASKSGDKGDNSIALGIANLRYAPILKDFTGALSPDEYYQSIILYMGNNGADSVRIADSQDKLVKSADASRLSITGVSMDEEMTNMMKFKYAYDAAARALNVIDNMMETIISRMGLAGR